MAINFTDSPANGATITQGNSTFTYNSTYGVWDRSIAASAISVYATLANLPLSDVSDDTIARVLDTDKLYIWNGTGWYYLPPTNENPTITTGGDATYALAADGSATVVTLEANDPEGFDIVWSYVVTAGSLGSTATVTQNNNVFTITPSTTEADAGDFTLTFTASDGVNLATSASAFTLAFAPPDWSLSTQQAKILASDGVGNDLFGSEISASIDGNTIIVGAHYAPSGDRTGAAYIFTRSGSTWTEQAKIEASDKQTDDWFAYSVSISGDGNTAALGAIKSSGDGVNESGAAYIFTRAGSTWTEQAKIVASDPETADEFGNAISISSDGNTVAVTAAREDTGGSGTGAMYIFTRSGSTWTEQAKIQASDKQASDWFGYNSVTLSSDGNTAAAGAYSEDTGGVGIGAAYIFTRSGSTWTEQAKIQASDKQAGDAFGWSVAISADGNTLAVGAQSSDDVGSSSGSAYIFTRSGSTWTEQAKLLSSDLATLDRFGAALDISSDGNTLVSTSRYHTPNGDVNNKIGVAYIFTRDGTAWTQQKKIQASDPAHLDQFGVSVAISGDGTTIISGAAAKNGSTGAAYIFAAG